MTQRGAITIPRSLRDAYGLEPGNPFTLLDLGGVFVLNPERSDIDELTDKIAGQWAKDGEAPETMLETLREERDRCVSGQQFQI